MACLLETHAPLSRPLLTISNALGTIFVIGLLFVLFLRLNLSNDPFVGINGHILIFVARLAPVRALPMVVCFTMRFDKKLQQPLTSPCPLLSSSLVISPSALTSTTRSTTLVGIYLKSTFLKFRGFNHLISLQYSAHWIAPEW